MYEQNEFYMSGKDRTDDNFCSYIRHKVDALPVERLVLVRRLVLQLQHTPRGEAEFVEMDAILKRLAQRGNRSRIWVKIFLYNWYHDLPEQEHHEEVEMRRFRLFLQDLKGKYGLTVSLLCRTADMRLMTTLLGLPSTIPAEVNF